MNSGVPYIWVQILAVFLYMLLLTAMLSAKKNKLIKTFIVVILSCFLWTAGSLFMRLNFPPSYTFWYQISVGAIFFLPLALYIFLYYFLNHNNPWLFKVSIIITVVVIILNYFECFVNVPVRQVNDSGVVLFVYNTDWRLIFPVIYYSMLLLMCVKLMRDSKDQCIDVHRLNPVFLGLGILILGNSLSVLPGNFFPFDIASGIIFVFLMFNALTQKRMIKLTLLVSRGALFVISITISILFCISLINPLSNFIQSRFPYVGTYSFMIVCVIFSIITLLIFSLLQHAIKVMFMRKEQFTQDQIKEFSREVSKTLELDKILSSLIHIINITVSAENIYICLKDKQNYYSIKQSSNPLRSRNLRLKEDNPGLKYFENNDECLNMEDFKRTTNYKAMWQSEKDTFTTFNIDCMIPLKKDSKLNGVVMLANTDDKKHYSVNDTSFLESVTSVAAVSIDNALMYENMRGLAHCDSLTGLFNRGYFLEMLSEKFEVCKDDSIALLIVNIDDFKLYNEMFGASEGDKILKYIASLLKNIVGKKGIVGRFSGKEFAIMLPYYNQMQTINLANNIQSQFKEYFGTDTRTLKSLTFSGGVGVYPYDASTKVDLIRVADMAVFKAKHSGKNKISTCTERIEDYNINSVVSKSNKDYYDMYASTIYALTAAIDAKDHYTFQHSHNVASYASVLAEHVGSNKEIVKIIYEAGLLHDIGKIAIAESILTKPGRLSNEEYEVMKSHVQHGVEIIKHLPNLDYLVPIAAEHHERYDGKGYPMGIGGEDICFGARCLNLADAFDAMTSKRCYKQEFSIAFAIKEIRNQAGKQFDPELSLIFAELVSNGTITINMEYEI